MTARVDVLIPTFRRKTGLAVVLTSLLGQRFTDFNVVVSDQSEDEGGEFVGSPVANPGQLADVRPDEQRIELWESPVEPEPFSPESIPWERHKVNNAAQPLTSGAGAL